MYFVSLCENFHFSDSFWYTTRNSLAKMQKICEFFNYKHSRNAKYNIWDMLISQTRVNLWSKSKGKLYNLDTRRSSKQKKRLPYVGSKSKSVEMRILNNIW